jgi:hypothetical protein
VKVLQPLCSIFRHLHEFNQWIAQWMDGSGTMRHLLPTIVTSKKTGPTVPKGDRAH